MQDPAMQVMLTVKIPVQPMVLEVRLKEMARRKAFLVQLVVGLDIAREIVGKNIQN